MDGTFPLDPRSLRGVTDIERALSEPTDGAIAAMARLQGDLMVLGVGGKMGPTLAMMARRASDAAGVKRRIIGVSRFSDPALEPRLRDAGIDTIRCDLLDRADVASLPDAPLIVYMAGRKFGSAGNEPLTWAMNCTVPGIVCERFAGSAIAAFSTGNVYGLCPVSRGGSVETDPLAPAGEYAMSCVGRERVFQHYSAASGTKVALLRLNYAVELRYGVLVDLATKVWRGQPVDVRMGYFNIIWQPDANAMALQSLELASAPARILNVTGPELLGVRDVCRELGRIMGREVTLSGEEAGDALLSDSAQAHALLGPPRVGADRLIRMTAEWVMQGGATLDKPTHFESRTGAF